VGSVEGNIVQHSLHPSDIPEQTLIELAYEAKERRLQPWLDAAHLPTPLTASGFNASLQDAATLAEYVSKAIRGDLANQALLEYESLHIKKSTSNSSVWTIIQSLF
jgi:2-polyprenyl-6-methoxyphenol hydroxylase-like FAD-dependent oxidoreductase